MNPTGPVDSLDSLQLQGADTLVIMIIGGGVAMENKLSVDLDAVIIEDPADRLTPPGSMILGATNADHD